MEMEEYATLTSALELLRKVLIPGDTKFTKVDWQMLQVARFLVSKEKFIKRDADNIVLHYGSVSSFYFIDELSQDLYDVAKYIYDNSSSLVIDRTKRVKYNINLDPKFKRYKNPTFEEAVIIINMVRNSIAHGKAFIDSENSLLRMNNSMMDETNNGILKFDIKAEIPISMLAKLDVANIASRNTNVFIDQVFEAIANRNFISEGNNIILLLNHHDEEVRFTLSIRRFIELYYEFEKSNKNTRLLKKNINEFNYDKYHDFNFAIKKKESERFRCVGGKGVFDEFKAKKDLKNLSSILELISNQPEKAIDPSIVKMFLELIQSESIPYDVRIGAMAFYREVTNSINFHKSAEESIDALSSMFGIKDEERSIEFVALYNYLTLLFASYPLKEGNALLTEFIDLSTLSIDISNTRDIEITNFYKDVEKIIKKHLTKFNNNRDQYNYERPCLTEYLKCITEILRKFKTRNNAYIRHIRNAVEHSDMRLVGQSIELRDYIHSSNMIDKTFRSRIHMSKLIELSAAYSYIYNIPTYKEYQTFVKDDENSFLSFTFTDMFRELGKGIAPDLIQEFIEMLNELSLVGLGREFDADSDVVDLVEELPIVMAEKRKGKGKSTT